MQYIQVSLWRQREVCKRGGEGQRKAERFLGLLSSEKKGRFTSKFNVL